MCCECVSCVSCGGVWGVYMVRVSLPPPPQACPEGVQYSQETEPSGKP